MSVSLELLLHSKSFIDKLCGAIKVDEVIPSASELKSILTKLLKGTNISPDYLKQNLTRQKILLYSRSDPKGYRLNHEKLIEISNTKLKDQQYPLLNYPEFIEALRVIMDDGKRIPTMKGLVEKMSRIKLPPKWKPQTIKSKLSELGILEYSRQAPKGYFLNKEKLDNYLKERGQIVQLHLDNSIIEQISETSEKSETLKKSAESNSSITESEVIGETKKSQEEESIARLKSDNRERDAEKNAERKTERKIEGKTNKEEIGAGDILDTIQSFPSYLLDRMPKAARSVMKIGILELSRLPLKDLEKYSSALSNARMFYDGAYDNERAIIDHIDEKNRYMNERMDKLHNEENERIIKTELMPKIKSGKFDKIINKLGKSRELDEVAFEIAKKSTKIRKKTSLNEFAFRRQISQILKELYSKEE